MYDEKILPKEKIRIGFAATHKINENKEKLYIIKIHPNKIFSKWTI